jgi:aminopeptidase N
MRTDLGQTIKLQDYKAPEYDIKSIALDVNLDDDKTIVIAIIEFLPNQHTINDKPLVLNGDELVLKSLLLNGQPLSADDYHITPQALTLKKPPKQPFKLTIETQLDPEANTQLMGLYRSNGVYCTQCEAEGFRRITYFLDRPDVLTTYTTRIIANKSAAPVLLANGNKIKEGDLEGGKHYAIWHDPHPKPSYLFALVGGDLEAVSDQFITRSGRSVELNIYVENGKARYADFALMALKKSMRWDEETYGCEYDLDIFNIVAVSDFNMGAMENKGLNIFNDQFILADPQTATDGNYHLIDSIIAHEYFHNWTGNRITCRDWFQLCLKEGLTVFRDQEYSEDQGSKIVNRIQEVMTVKSAQFREDAGPLAHPVRPNQYSEINNFYTATVYRKGAEVIRMLKTILGKVGFFKGIQLYFSRHDGTASTIEEFITCFEDANDVDLRQFFLWYQQAGTPSVYIDQHYDAESGSLTLNLKQKTKPTPGQAIKQAFHIPLKFGLVGKSGNDLSFHVKGDCPVSGDIIHLINSQATVTFTKLSEKPVLSIGREFSAPINIEMEQSLDDLKFLAFHDGDLYNRWQSVQNIVMKHLIDASTKDNVAIPSDLLDILVQLTKQSDLDPHYRATLLSLPTPQVIANAIGNNIDPDKICSAFRALQIALGKSIISLLPNLFKTLEIKEHYKHSAEQVGKRALTSVLLTLGCAANDSDTLELCKNQYYHANNMSTRLNAISSYMQFSSDEIIRKNMLQHFYENAKGNPLIHDKWFAIQAMDSDPNCLVNVIQIMGHSAFSIENPNRVRALIGTFAMNNMAGFHRKDGMGYQFLARVCIEIDKKNPQLAARILTAFSMWKDLEPIRRKHAQTALESIAARDNLSTDTHDIVNRTLGSK